MSANSERPEHKIADLSDRIKQLLTEIRIILPGIQALLAFQLAAVLQLGFDRLSPPLKTIHLVSLSVTAVCTILLMTPAAYHRIVYDGDASEQFERFASRMLLASLGFLALGLAGDHDVVVAKVFNSQGLGGISAILSLVFFYGLWFGYMWIKRKQIQL